MKTKYRIACHEHERYSFIYAVEKRRGWFGKWKFVSTGGPWPGTWQLAADLIIEDRKRDEEQAKAFKPKTTYLSPDRTYEQFKTMTGCP